MPTGKRKLHQETLSCDEFKDTPHLIEHLKKLSAEKSLQEHLTKIILGGYRGGRLQIDTEALENTLKDHFFQLLIEDETLPLFDMERLREERTARGTFVRNMLDRMSRFSTEDKERESATCMALYRGLESYTSEKVIVP